MRTPTPPVRLVLAASLLSLCACAQAGDTPAPLRVQLPASATASASGRLVLFAQPAAEALANAKDGKVAEVDASPFGGGGATAAGMDVARIAPGQSLPVDTDGLVWPTSFSDLPDGEYYAHGFAILELRGGSAEAEYFQNVGGVLKRLVEAKYPLTGASDHGVSEALYLNDPDGNGVELYRDRPEAEWPRNPDGTLAMVTRALDLRALLAEAA